MTDLTKMSKEELVTAILGPDVELQGEFAKTHRAELLRRLGAAPSEGIKPGLLGVLLKAVDDGEANWRKGGCLENGCACWTEHVKEAIRAALSPARSEEPSAPQTNAELEVCDQYGFGATPERAAPQPVSGAAPEWIMKPCPKELAAIMSSPADWLITRVDGNSRHTLYFSNEELEKLCQGYLQVIPLERLKDLRATGDAPKVEKIARQLSQKFGFHSSRVLTYEGALEFLRPYFPPASQTPPISEHVLNEIVLAICEIPDRTSPDDFPEAMIVTPEELRFIIRDKFEQAATPASTARTDALLNLLRAADDVLAEQSLINQRFTQKQDALFAELMGWRDANGILAAPGSVPQTPNNHSDLFFGNLQYSLQTLFAKVGNPFKDLAEWGAVWEALESARKHFGVPQAEPPKEEKPWITGKL